MANEMFSKACSSSSSSLDKMGEGEGHDVFGLRDLMEEFLFDARLPMKEEADGAVDATLPRAKECC